MSGSYREAYDASTQDPNAFWLAAADAIDWMKKPTKALDDRTAPVYGWYPDAEGIRVCRCTSGSRNLQG